MSKPTPARRPRRWWKALAVALVASLGLLSALPWLIANGPFRSRVDSGLNRAMAPGRIQFEGLQLSWFGPTRLDDVAILDPKGEAVIKASSMVYDRTLAQLLLRDHSPATLTFEGASFEVTRSDDGSLNLTEALRTVIASPDPKRDVTIRVANGSIRYHDPFLAEPAVAESVDFTLRVPYAPSAVTWVVKLGQGSASLESQGEFDLWVSRGGPPRTPELQIGVVSKHWPFVARTAGVDAIGHLDGSLDFTRKRGRWVFSGEARLDGLNSRGKTLAGDTLVFEKCEAGWDLAEGEDGWKIRRLSVTSPLGQLKAEGQLNGPGGVGKQRIEGQLDLAEIARQLPHALHLREGLTVDRGLARVAVDLTSEPGRTSFEIEAKVADLAARHQGHELSFKDQATVSGRIVREADESRVERLSVHTSFLDASAKGRLDDGVDLTGRVDLSGFRKQLGQWVDLGNLDLAGQADISGRYALEPRSAPVGGQPSFRNHMVAKIKDLRIDGYGQWAIRRDSTTVELTLEGPAQTSGIPEGWRQLAVNVQSGKLDGRLSIQGGDGPSRLTASASTPVKLGARTRTAGMTLNGERTADGRSMVLERVLLSLNQADPGPAGASIQLAAQGKIDLSSGELFLENLQGSKPDAIVIDPDGLRIAGLAQGLESLRIDGGVSGELSGLDSLVADATGRTPLGLSGRWSAVANARGDANGLTLAGKIGLADPSGERGKPNRPTRLALRAHYAHQSDQLDLTEFTVSTRYGTLDASGKLEEATGDAVVDLNGVVSPDFEAINALLAARVEPGARVVGKPRAFRASGPLRGTGSPAWKGLDAEVGFDLAGADIYGMKFGPSPIVLRTNRGRLLFDPISTTLNEGHIRLEPEVDLDAPGGPLLRMAKNSTIREARINDEVSKRVLAYVAPILDQATRASGLVSVDLDHAEFPIGPGRGRQAKVEGAVVFQDVEFAPGPLASEILGAIGRRDLSLKLDQPVTLTIADGRVNQRGMGIPLGGLTRIELNGWVDFDRNLALNATIPVTPAMLGNNPLLADIAAGTKVHLPITGTLDHPMIDQDVFTTNLQELGKSLLTRGATRGAMELLMRLARPRDPDAPPPPARPTPEQRKANKQEKKAIRRGEIPPPPADGPRP
jgi:translocation and assembly module TamB